MEILWIEQTKNDLIAEVERQTGLKVKADKGDLNVGTQEMPVAKRGFRLYTEPEPTTEQLQLSQPSCWQEH